jgi:transcriptional regulator with XRE-family HTH domain
VATFGQRVRELRQKKDLSLRELATRLGNLTAPYLSDIELGRRYPSGEVLEKMAKVLEVSIDELRALDPRPPVEGLKKRGSEDPQLGVALRQVVDRKVSGADLMKLLEKLKSARKKD